ncbi:MAG: glycogen debranching enzyme GlgX, partial [Chthoniobacteraceae bacterium]
ALFDIIRQDPVLSQVKLIAEPWDIGLGGYQVGNFPAPFVEWNGKYRDCVRDYWKGDEGTVGEFARRLTGSADMFQWDTRPPSASVNFIVAHDGFTLADLVSYNEKHNEANGESNADGESHNRSWNCGEEGPSDDAEINALRARQMRNFMTTLFLSQGVPILCAGDEYGRSQGGNNNCYCQDNELSWLAWHRDDAQRCLERFVARLIHFRREHPIFRRRAYFSDKKVRGTKIKEIIWLSPSGNEMSEDEWHSPHVRCVGVTFAGTSIERRTRRGEPIHDDTFMMLFNAHHEAVTFVLGGQQDVRWQRVIDTSREDGFLPEPTSHEAGDDVLVEGRSLSLLQLVEGTSEHARTPSWKPRPAEIPRDPAVSIVSD